MLRSIASVPAAACFIAAVVAAPACAASASEPAAVAAPSGVLNLSASSTVDVARDTMTVGFTASRDGTDAGTVQTQLKQALDAALAEARRVAKAGQIDVQTGSFSLSPRYAPKGGINGWQGSAELIVEGRDLAGIAQLAGRVSTMSIGRVGYSISREARAKAEEDAAAQAIASFRAMAAAMVKRFGFADYALREVNVNTNDAAPPPYPMMARAAAMSKTADEALPVEAGKGSITAQVSGSVQMR